MASTKEAIGIILDVGPSMDQAPPGGTSCLQTSIDAINMILQRKLFSESKDEIALILLGTENTANELADGESYENITVARPLGPVDWQLLDHVQNNIEPSTQNGDFLDAIVVAMDHLVKGITGKRGFVSKRVILFSDMASPFGEDNIDDIMGSMKEAEIEFNVIGPDLDDDDEEDGPKPGTSGEGDHQKAKTPQQLSGEAMLRHIIAQCDGASYSFDEVLPSLSYFQSRAVRPTPWKTQLDIAGILSIPIAAYHKMKEAKAKSFKNVYARDPECELERLRTYHLNDEEETEIEKSDVVDGHRYGSTLVPFSEDDKEAFKYATEKCLSVIQFTQQDNIQRHLLLGDFTMAVVAEKGDETAAVALSAIINALHDTNCCAITRRCYGKNSPVKLGVLVPHIKANYECLFYNEIPFSEDMRQFTFSSLPLKEETSAANKKFAPTDEQLNLMDDLIDNMDLCNAIKDEDDEPEEVLKPKLTFNPYLQRLYQCLQHRASNPDDPIPDLSPIIAKYLEPPQEVTTKCSPVLEKMKEKFKLVQVEKKKDEAASNMFQDNADGGDDPAAKKAKVDDAINGGMADIVKAKVTEVGTVNPVDDFKAIIGQKDEDRVEEAMKMMQKRVEQVVMDSFGSQSYGKAMDCLKSLRAESIKNAEAQNFNTFMTGFKDTLAEKGRKDFWEEIVSDKVGLISKVESEDSKVSKEEAEGFLKEKEEKKEESAKPAAEDVDDLLDDF